MNGWAWPIANWFTVLYLLMAASFWLALISNEEKAPRVWVEHTGAVILSFFWPVALLARLVGRLL